MNTEKLTIGQRELREEMEAEDLRNEYNSIQEQIDELNQKSQGEYIQEIEQELYELNEQLSKIKHRQWTKDYATFIAKETKWT